MNISESIISFSFFAMQITGIFIAIIGGLIATKILSMNTEISETIEKEKDLENKIKHEKQKLKDMIRECIALYKESELEDIIDYIFEENKDYTIYDYENPYVYNIEREKFFNEINLYINDFIGKVKNSDDKLFEQFEKKGLEKSTLEYKILDYSISNYSKQILEKVYE